MQTSTRTSWSNSSNTFTIEPLQIMYPESLNDLVQCVQQAESAGVRVRAVGSGHSFSDVNLADDYLVDIVRLNRFLKVQESELKAEHRQRKFVQFESGITIRNFNDGLDERGLAIPNMGGIDHQKMAGAINTGTHGTGVDLPSIAGMVQSLTLVAAGGKIYRIEPTDGITNPSAFGKANQELIQNDDVFHSVVVGLGCMGMVYSYIVEVWDAYWLRETRVKVDWAEARDLLLGGNSAGILSDVSNDPKAIAGKLRASQVHVNPYATAPGKRSALITRYYYQAEAPRRSLGERMRNLLSSIGGEVPIAYKYTMWKVRKQPEKLPKMIDASINTLKDKVYINTARKALYQGAEFVKLRAYDAEFAFDLDADRYVQATEACFEFAAFAAKHWKLYQTSPMGMRFTEGEPHYMAPNYQRNVIYIDTPFLVGTPGAPTLLNRFQEIMIDFGGIPHWGKVNNKLTGRADLIRKWYPQFDAWQQNYLRFNSSGVFASRFTDRMEFAEVGAS